MTKHHKSVSVNSKMFTSSNGKAAIAKDEGFSSHPYNDQAKHCTVGTGILIHKGPCTPAELKKTYDTDVLSKTFQSRLSEAQGYVAHYVSHQKLSQAEFDALTSFVFNVGVGHAKNTLSLVNTGEKAKAANEMDKFINVKTKDKKGKIHVLKSNGLIHRRTRETAPFHPVKPPKHK